MSLEHITGLKEFAHAMRELPEALAKDHLKQAVAIPARVIRDAARANVASHTKTGLLYKSIVVKKEASNALQAVYVIAVRHSGKFNAYYWTFLEFGTRRAPAYPFLRPAYEANKDRCLTLMLNGIKFGLETEGRNLSWSRAA